MLSFLTVQALFNCISVCVCVCGQYMSLTYSSSMSRRYVIVFSIWLQTQFGRCSYYQSLSPPRNYGPTIRIQKVAEAEGCSQVLWLLGEDNQVGPFINGTNDHIGSCITVSSSQSFLGPQKPTLVFTLPGLPMGLAFASRVQTIFPCTQICYCGFLLQLTEVGTMNIFVHWINEDGGTY